MRRAPGIALPERPFPPVARDSLLARFAPLIRSDLALRLARNKVEFGLEIPPLSDDPWEHYLVCEALLFRFTEEVKEKARDQQAWTDARETGKALIEQHRREQGLA
jgi:hypothetical protein